MGSRFNALMMAALAAMVVIPAPSSAVSGERRVDESGFLLLPEVMCVGVNCVMEEVAENVGDLPGLADTTYMHSAEFRFNVPAFGGQDHVAAVELDLTSHTGLDRVHIRLCHATAITGGLACFDGIDETVSDDKSWVVTMNGGPKSEWVLLLDLDQGADVHFLVKVTDV